MGALEPGEPFPVVFGNQRTVQAVAMDLRTKGKVAKLMAECRKGGEGAFDLLEQAITLCCPGITDDEWKHIDEAAAGEIISAALLGSGLKVDEEKKSESLP